MKKHIFKARKISIYLISIYLIAEITGDICITTKEAKNLKRYKWRTINVQEEGDK